MLADNSFAIRSKYSDFTPFAYARHFRGDFIVISFQYLAWVGEVGLWFWTRGLRLAWGVGALGFYCKGR